MLVFGCASVRPLIVAALHILDGQSAIAHALSHVGGQLYVVCLDNILLNLNKCLH